MSLTDKIHICYAEIDESRAKEVIESIFSKLRIPYDLYSVSEQKDKEAFFTDVLVPRIESAEHIVFLYSKEGANDIILKQQFTTASNLNKPILPVIIETNSLYVGILKVKSPFPFRTDSLNYDDEDERIMITEQIHAALGLVKHGDIYGSSVSIVSDRTAIVCRGDEILGKAVQGEVFNIVLAKGTHKLVFIASDDGLDVNLNDINANNVQDTDADWVEYVFRIPDNNSSFECRPCFENVDKVRKNKIVDLMFDPTNQTSLEWDTLSDTKEVRLSRSSQDIKKRDVVIASFYRKYIENLTPEPELRYTQIKLLPSKYISYLCYLLTVCIWGKALIWLLAFALYAVTLTKLNWAGQTWDWLCNDTSFEPLLWSIYLWIIYKVYCFIATFVVQKKDQIRNSAAISKVSRENDTLYKRLNSLQTSFLESRGWKVEILKPYPNPYPSSKLTFDYSTLPDNSESYSGKSYLDLSFSSEQTAPKNTKQGQTKLSLGKNSLAIIFLLIMAVAFYFVKQRSVAEETIRYNETFMANGNIMCSVDGVEFTMVKVEGGSYQMGNSTKQSWDYEKPVHNVTVSDFYIGEFEVTQKLWLAIMDINPSENQESLLNPVETISWDHCQEFIRRLNEITGQNFRLPTEAEWEYAARGGNKSSNTKYSGSALLDEVGWYKENSGKKTHPVGQLKPNELGIYDMTGNVWEWVADYHDYYPKQDQVDPTGPTSGGFRVHRGGGCENGKELSRLTIRAGGDPTGFLKTLGFRLAKPIQ